MCVELHTLGCVCELQTRNICLVYISAAIVTIIILFPYLWLETYLLSAVKVAFCVLKCVGGYAAEMLWS